MRIQFSNPPLALLYTKNDFIAAYIKDIIPHATLITPNIHEASMITGIPIRCYEDMIKAAKLIRTMGAKAVLIKGGDFEDPSLASDYFEDETQSWWMNQYRVCTIHTHGTGCTLSSAIAAGIAQGWPLRDALILAKAYVHAGLSFGSRAGIAHVGLHDLRLHFPWITAQPQPLPPPFKAITGPIGRYPVVDNLHDLKILCSKGIAFIQLRVKNPEQATQSLFQEALDITRTHNVHLVVNDYLDIARNIQAPALHLGQEDIATEAIHTLNRDEIMLGISGHNLYEMARGYAHHPSYLTMGPIFKTTSKIMDHPVVGMEKLAFITQLCPLPLVAIGGITHEQATEVLKLPCSGAAFINASKQLMGDGRYDKHFMLPGFAVSKQQRLFKARVACVGIGGLAAGFLPYLAGAGIGSLTLIDHDTVNHNNLHRQILFQDNDVGRLKVHAAVDRLHAQQALIKLQAIPEKLTPKNASTLLQGYDLIIDGTDNFESHYLINDTARSAQTPLIAAAVFKEQGHVFYFSPQSGCYRCAFPETGNCASCELAGIIGTVPGVMGILQAHMAIQVLLGEMDNRDSLCQVLSLHSSASQMKTLRLPQNKDCPCHSATVKEYDQSLLPNVSID